MELNQLEQEVLSLLLRGEHPILRMLRNQCKFLQVVSRKYTGAGFYTDFRLNDESKINFPINLTFGDVTIEISGLKNAGGFLLYIEKGKISMLEAFSFGLRCWPNEIKNYQLSYDGKSKRDFNKFYKKLDILK